MFVIRMFRTVLDLLTDIYIRIIKEILKPEL